MVHIIYAKYTQPLNVDNTSEIKKIGHMIIYNYIISN